MPVGVVANLLKRECSRCAWHYPGAAVLHWLLCHMVANPQLHSSIPKQGSCWSGWSAGNMQLDDLIRPVYKTICELPFRHTIHPTHQHLISGWHCQV